MLGPVKREKSKAAASLGKGLRLGPVHDQFEQEADTVADQVVQRFPLSGVPPAGIGQAAPSIQRKCADCEEEDQVRRKPLGIPPKPQAVAPSVGPRLGGQIQAARGGGSGLGGSTLAQMNAGFGTDLSRVRVHTDGKAAALSRQLGAKAFTVGNDIFFGAGQFQPNHRAGQHLLAHELTHTLQQSGGTLVQRTPDLTLPEIDPATQASIDTNDEYQWENKQLLDTVFNDPKSAGNDRLLALRNFLFLQKELEVNAKVPELSGDMTPERLQEVIAEQVASIEAEIAAAEKIATEAQAELTAAKAAQPAAKAEMEAAKKALATLLKADPRAKELHALRGEVKKKQEKARESLVNVERNINWLKHTGRYTTDPDAVVSDDQKFWDSRRDKAQKTIDDEQRRVTDTDTEYEALVGPSERELVDKTMAAEALKTKEKEAKARRDAAQKTVKELNALLATIKKAKEGKENALRDFKLKVYGRELDAMNHGQLMDTVLALFKEDDTKAAADPAYVRRFPDWQRYAVIHYSGMRYRNAHGSWFDPTKILKHLRSQELASTTDEQRRIMQAEAEKTADNETLKAEGVSSKTRKALAAVMPDTVRKSLKAGDAALYDDVLKLEQARSESLLGLQESGTDPARAAELRKAIAQHDSDISALIGKMTEKGRKAVEKAIAQKASLLQQIAHQRAMDKVKQLTSGQAFAVLKAMHDNGQIPEAVWRELLAFTEGRVQTGEQAWESDLKLKSAKGATADEEASIRQWESVLRDSGFYKNTTGWREQHSKTLSPSIVSSMVCDQLGSQLQHLRGHKRPGGLRKNAMYYKDQQAAGTSGAYFRPPASVDDLKVGASIYWFEWTDNAITSEYAKLWEKQKPQQAALARHQGDLKAEQEKRDARDKRDPAKFALSDGKRKAIDEKIGGINKKIADTEAKLAEMKAQQDAMRVWAPEKDKLPDISNIVSPDPSSGSDISIGRLKFKQNFTDADGWTYRSLEQEIPVMRGVTRRATVIMRVKPNPYYKSRKIEDADFSFSTDKEVLKQWMGWTHEATIMYADSSMTMTFDTSAKYDGKEIKGMSTRRRSTAELLSSKNVFIGYSPDANPLGHATPNLDLTTKGMQPEAYEMTDTK